MDIFFCINILEIDNNKVIHLVKRQIRSNESNSSSNNQNSNNQRSNRTSSRSRIRSYRNDDGTFFMGSFSMDPPSLINQVMRQIFPSHRQNTSSQTDNNANTTIRLRFNQIRQLLSYVEANFQLLENPNQLPRAIMGTELFEENYQFSPADYVKCFNDVLNFIERARPLLSSWFGTFNSNNSNQLNSSNDNLTLIRIIHHISHILHALTDLHVDQNNDPPISVNVLSENSMNINIPNILNSVRSNIISNINGTNESNSGEENSGNNDSNNAQTANAENESNNNETQDPPLPPMPSISLPIPSRFNSLGGRNVFMAQSPILLMEVDATINGHRTSIGSRSIPNFSISDFNVTVNNLLNNARNFNFVPMNSTGGNNANNDNTSNDSTQSANESNTVEQNNDASTTQSQANNDQQNSTNDSNESTPPQPPPLTIVFDPYLNWYVLILIIIVLLF